MLSTTKPKYRFMDYRCNQAQRKARQSTNEATNQLPPYTPLFALDRGVKGVSDSSFHNRV
jgi:hypothetical protein